jgi:hypothetical protein
MLTLSSCANSSAESWISAARCLGHLDRIDHRHHGHANFSVYSASKAAVRNLAR